MRCLSVRQPWAWAICSGEKTIENRSWATDYRGTIAVHASASQQDVNWVIRNSPNGGVSREAFAYGKPNQLTGQHIELDVVLDDRESITRREIKTWLRRLLPVVSQPSRIRVVTEIPRSHRFKRTGGPGRPGP